MSTHDSKPLVEPSSEALKMAQKWLAKKGLHPKLEDGSSEVAKPRPAGLGLGASFLPHHKGTITAVGLETQLRKRLARSQDGGLQRAREGGSAAQSIQQEDDDDSEEESGRAAAFAAKPKPARKADSAAEVVNRLHAPFKRPNTKRKKGKHQAVQTM